MGTPDDRAVRRPKQRRLPAAARRELVLDAALRVFAEQGSSAPIADIADAAGVTRTVAYHYFGTKQELFVAVVERQAGELMRRLAPLVSLDTSAEDRARALIAAIVTFADEEPLGWDLLFRPGDDDPQVGDARDQIFSAAKSSFLDLVFRELAHSDQVHRQIDPESVTAKVSVEGGLAATIAIIGWWRSNRSIPREDVIDTMFELLWTGIAGVLREANGTAT